MERGNGRIIDGYAEKHHIIPRCMGGDDKARNIVSLTPEEHYVAHQLLVKIYPDNRKLICAAGFMRASKTGARSSNKEYGWLKRKFSDSQSGENNHRFGIDPWNKGLKLGPLSEEHKKNVSESLKGRVFSEEHSKRKSEAQTGEKNHRFGKPSPMKGKKTGKPSPFKGKKHTDESLLKMSESRTGTKQSEESNAKRSAKLMGNKNGRGGKGKTLSEEHKRRIAESKIGKKRGPYKKRVKTALLGEGN